MVFALRSLGSKLYRLRRIFRVHDSRLSILRVYFFGGDVSDILHDLRGGRLPIKVSMDNLEKISRLGIILARRARSWGKYISSTIRFNDNHYLMTDTDDVKWIVRRASPILLKYDVLFGPLLFCHQEPREYEWFSKILHEGDIFIDVGANVGGYSVRACKIGARVIAVEPDPDNYRVLKINLKLNQCFDAHILNIAAGRREEVLELYESSNGAPVGYSLLQAKKRKKVKCSVNVKPLDVAIPPLLNNEWVDLLKIDVEGVEAEVIKGALDLLKRTRYMIVEVIPSTRSRMLEMLDLLRPLGFKLIDKVCRQSLYCDLFLGKSG